ncbi:TPA: lytic transglycosylase domain-containing protein [Yersinia enterocolitica]
MIGLEMMATCAPNVAPTTIERIINVESAGQPLAVNANVKWVTVRDKDGKPVMITTADGQTKPERKKVVFKSPIEIKTVQDAVTVAYMAIDAGHSVDLSYMQVNSKNLKALGYSVEDMFDPCKNLAAGSRVLTAFYSAALPKYSNEQAALRAALSAYNTGDFEKGFTNGYLARYGVNGQSTALVSVPAINPYAAASAVSFRQQPKKEEAMSTKEEVKPALAQRVEPVVSKSQDDAATPGVQVEHPADQAEANGAFKETALSEADAWESNADIAAEDAGTAIPFGRKQVRQTVKRDTSDIENMKPEDAAAITANANINVPLKGGK